MPTLSRAGAAICILLVSAVQPTVSVAQRDLTDIPVPDPEQEQATFRLPEGFEVNLFAADPRIAKPIQMNFDPSGRLWIVSSEVYPHIEPGAQPTDRVLVLEDKDHDGVSDETHEFATGLLIPTGIAPGDGGAYVANSTELLHFSDTDGDLVADSKRVVLSGFGTEDTHHILHTLRWGPDGYLYFNQSIYIHSHIETPWGVRRLNAGGIWQFRPETMELGVFMRGLVNSWGHHFDRFGQSFATDGAGGEGINYIVPGAYYVTAADAPRLLRGLNPGSPKHCGLEILETPMLPPEWQGSAVTNDFRGHRVCRFRLNDDRSGYTSREQQEVVWSDHVAFRPIDVKLGPDGAIYIADWYNPIIQHGEVDFRDPRRDHTHGRIWRISWKDAPTRPFVDIASLNNQQLVQMLREHDGYRRQMARQVLRERSSSASEAVAGMKSDKDVDADNDMRLLEALWAHQCIREIDLDLLQSVLEAADGRIRAAGVRVLNQWKHLLPANGQSMLQRLVNDPHPRVRLEAVRALSFSPNPRENEAGGTDQALHPIEVIMQATDHETDTFLNYAIWLSSYELAAEWVPQYQAGNVTFGNNIQHLLAAFEAVGGGAPIDSLLEKLYLSTTSGNQRTKLIQLVASSGNAKQLASLVTRALGRNDLGPVRATMQESRRRNNMAVQLSPETYRDWLAQETSGLRQAGLEAMGQWKAPGALNHLGSHLSGSESLSDRMAAATGIALFGGTEAVRLLQQVTSKESPLGLRIHAAALLTGLAPQKGADVTAGILADMTPENDPSSLARSFMVVRNGDTILADSLSGVSLNRDIAREVLSVVREAGRSAPELESALRKAGRLTSRKSLSPKERLALLETAKNDVTAAEGEKIFRNERLGCLKCHAVGGAGGEVGPDMISLGGSAQPDYLLESLLNPNAKVKENYNTIVIVTVEGRIVSGVRVKQSKTEVDIRTAEGRLITIARDRIEEIGNGVSLMPEGLVDSLTDREIAALVRFLSELGRTPKYTLSRRRLARTWDVMQATQQAAFRLRRTSYAMAATNDESFTWRRTISKVSGELPLSDIPTVSVRNRSAAGNRGVGFVRCRLNVETPGQVCLRLNETTGLELRLGDVPIDMDTETLIDVTPGIHRLTFTVDQSVRTAPLELEILDSKTTSIARFAD